MTANPTEVVDFQMAAILVRQFAILPESFRIADPVQNTNQFNIGHDVSERVVGAILHSRFHHTDNQTFLLIEAGCLVKVDTLAWEKWLLPDSQTVRVPKWFLQHLGSLSVGTVRGILHERTMSTPFQSFMLPPIHVESLLAHDFDLPLLMPNSPTPHG